MRYLVFIAFLIPLLSFAQKNSLEVYLDCYKNGDTLSIETLQNVRNISLLKNGTGQKDSWFKSWEMVVHNGSKVSVFSSIGDSPTIAGAMSDAIKNKSEKFPDKIVIQAIMTKTKSGEQIIEKKIPSSTFYIVKKARKSCK